jgi:hypothetical protein
MFILLRSTREKACGALRLACFFFALSCFFGQLAEAGHAAEIQLLQQQASISQMAFHRAWQVLLRYRPASEGWQSLVDDRAYFLSEQGKSNPEAELSASIEALYLPAELGDEHFSCRFPARTEWLMSTLAIEPASLPRAECRKLEEALATVRPRSAVLVFPAAHNNGPASMFGHTLLRIGSTYESELLSHAINYAAHSTDSNGLIYAFKGLFGFYNGYFTVLPYYEKLNEYNDLEHRDVWEYQLNLTEAEVRRLVLHSWEQQQIASDYYFFDENCSFMLLFLLEAARPELRLAESYWQRSSFWVIPVDTISTIRAAGLVEKVSYRPALATRISHRASLLRQDLRETAHAVAMQKTSAEEFLNDQRLAAAERQQVLELSSEYLRYRYSRRELTEDEFKRQFLPILQARSRLGPGEVVVASLAQPSLPEQGHKAGLVTAGTGARDSRSYLELGWRPAYHALLDADEGFTRGAQINFLSLRGRYYLNDNSLRLQSLKVVDIVSLAPRDLFFKPVSWKVNGGVQRKLFADGTDKLYLGLNTGGGLAWSLLSDHLVYVMAEADLNASDRWQHKTAIGAGGTAGLLLSPTKNWKAHLSINAMAYTIEKHEEYRIIAEQSYRLNRQLAILLHGARERSYSLYRTEISIALNHYF